MYAIYIYIYIFISVSDAEQHPGRVALGSGHAFLVLGLGLQFDDGGPGSEALVPGPLAKIGFFFARVLVYLGG